MNANKIKTINTILGLVGVLVNVGTFLISDKLTDIKIREAANDILNAGGKNK